MFGVDFGVIWREKAAFWAQKGLKLGGFVY